MKTLIKKARRTAGYTNVRRSHMAAIAFTDSGNVIASAHNRRVSGRPEWTEHAEDVLLQKLHKIKAFQRYQHVNILVVRVLKRDGSLSLAKPCPECQRKLSKVNVSVWFTTSNNTVEQL